MFVPATEDQALAGLQAARRGPAGLEPYPTRAAIWAGALAGQHHPRHANLAAIGRGIGVNAG